MSGTGTEISKSVAQDKDEAAHKVRQGEKAVKINEEEPEKDSGNPFAQMPAGIAHTGTAKNSVAIKEKKNFILFFQLHYLLILLTD